MTRWENDEVHQQGQAWMGFAWKLRTSLIAKLGEEAGRALAESLIIPTMLAKAGDIPAAMAQVLLNDMDKSGLMPHENEIRAAAKAHGIDLPKAPGRITSFINGTASLSGALLNASASDAVAPVVHTAAKTPARRGGWLTRRLIQNLGSSHETVRQLSAMALTRMGSSAVGPLLYAAQHDGSVLVRSTALTILGDVGGPAIIPELQALTENADPGIAKAARDAIRAIGNR